jgi:hypothetical protein
MKSRIPSPALVLSAVALFVAVGGGAAVAAGWSGSEQQVKHLITQSSAGYVQSKHFVTSGGEHFFGLGKTVVLGKAGHFTFLATCSSDSGGAQSVTFSVRSNSYADLDGTGPAGAGTLVAIHQDSDALNGTPDAPLKAGDFTQVGSASSSTEIAGPDGQEVDVFYNDGVNWPRQAGGKIPCFAGYTGFLG